MILNGLEAQQLTGVLVVAVAFLLFIITITLYYRLSVRPLQPYLYLSGLLSAREQGIRTRKELLSTTYETMESLQDAYSLKKAEHEENNESSSPMKTIDAILNRQFKETFEEIHELSPRPMKTILQTHMMFEEMLLLKLLYKRAWQIENSEECNLTSAEIKTLPSGTIDSETIEQALKAETTVELSRAFNATRYERILKETPSDFQAFVKSLDNLFSIALDETRLITKKPGYKHLKLFLASIIDMHNLVLTMKRFDTSESFDLYEGGTIPRQKMLIIQDVQELLEMLQKTSYAQTINTIIEQESSKAEIQQSILIGIRRHLMSFAKQESTMKFQHPIRVLSFILDKQSELMNIRMLALGIENGIAKKTLERYMV
ncbi:MAG: V-type ATPase subunit [Candidatus Woesearchaeota archaeon]